MDTVQQLIDAFNTTGIRFNDRADALAKFREEHHIDHTEEGVFTVYDGERVKLSDALTRYSFDNRDLVDGRTLPREGAGTSRPGTDHRGNYATVKERVDFISKHGLAAWEKLPTSSVSTAEVATIADWKQLPVAERVRRLNADPDAIRKLKPTPTNRVAGAYVNHEKLEQLRKIRPGSR